jgi:hypothetical protein
VARRVEHRANGLCLPTGIAPRARCVPVAAGH